MTCESEPKMVLVTVCDPQHVTKLLILFHSSLLPEALKFSFIYMLRSQIDHLTYLL